MSAESTSNAVAKLLQRQSQQPWSPSQRTGPMLVINPDGDALTFLDADAWCFHAGHAKHWQRAFCQAQPPDLSSYRGALLVVAKEQTLNHYILMQLQALAAGSPIWLVGEKRGGVMSLVKRLPDGYGATQKLASGNHCQLFETHVETSHKAPQLHQFMHSVAVDLTDVQFSLQSLPGVFSQQRLDVGTRLLLEHLPKQLKTPIVDFACGSGVIAATLHKRQQPKLYLSDVNPLAVAAAQHNLAAADAEVFLNDGLPEDIEGVGTIVSNPPFHTGLRTDYQIAKQFIRDAYQALRKGADLYLVANRFLPWPEAIEAHFGHCNRIVETNKFCVYHAQRK